MPRLPAGPVDTEPQFQTTAGRSSRVRGGPVSAPRANPAGRVKFTAPVALGLAGSSAGTRSGRRRLAVSDSQRGVGELLGERGRLLSVAAQAS
jgi:hypothetical protein